jgi:hypothetical protein
MPRFVDLFVDEIHKKRSRLKAKVEKGQVSPRTPRKHSESSGT